MKGDSFQFWIPSLFMADRFGHSSETRSFSRKLDIWTKLFEDFFRFSFLRWVNRAVLRFWSLNYGFFRSWSFCLLLFCLVECELRLDCCEFGWFLLDHRVVFCFKIFGGLRVFGILKFRSRSRSDCGISSVFLVWILA